VEGRHDRMKVVMEMLMSKFDKNISRQGVPSCKEKEVEMPTIKAIVNYKSASDHSEDKKRMSFQRLMIRKLL
jgi:hypothetical protein